MVGTFPEAPSGSRGMPRGDQGRGIWATGRMVMDRVIPSLPRGAFGWESLAEWLSVRAASNQGRCLVVIDLR
jgi:hypothetical protein